MNCFIYARKSTESEDRQVLSIEAQINELKAVALRQGLKIVEVFSEAKSAKAPGRQIFENMMTRVIETKGVNILCWKLDRLARNPVDGGKLIWSVEQKQVQQIVTPHRTFCNYGDDKFWMQLEFGIAKKYVDDLSDNVKRGNRAKLEKGILPGKAPIGYLNDKEIKTIKKDPDRFHLVRRIWDIILTGDYSIKEILRTADEDWGLTTPQCKLVGGRPLIRSGLYKLLSNPFYYGAIRRQGQLYPGSHQPMITKDEFDRVQKILGRSGRCAQKKYFAYTGLINCLECGGMITAEQQTNRYGYQYTYYRCSKKKGGRHNSCSQKYIRAENLEAQILSYLEKIYLPKKFVKWSLSQLKEAVVKEEKTIEKIKKSQERALIDNERRLQGLLQMKLRDLLSDEEYLAEKDKLTDKKLTMQSNIGQIENSPGIWLEPSQRFFSFLTLAKDKFKNGDDSLKRQILATVGSNLLLKDKILLIEAKKPFRLVVDNDKSLLGLGRRDSNPRMLGPKPSALPLGDSPKVVNDQ